MIASLEVIYNTYIIQQLYLQENKHRVHVATGNDKKIGNIGKYKLILVYRKRA
jgi:hypothetical protein